MVRHPVLGQGRQLAGGKLRDKIRVQLERVRFVPRLKIRRGQRIIHPGPQRIGRIILPPVFVLPDGCGPVRVLVLLVGARDGQLRLGPQQ